MARFYEKPSFKRKRVVVDDMPPEYCSVKIMVHGAEDIDRATRNPKASDRRRYRVFAWIRPDVDEECSPIAPGLPNPRWDWTCNIPVGLYQSYYCLHLELCRVQSKSDPGTSNGRILVGRTQIPLPQIGYKVTNRYGLVVPTDSGSVAEGHIIVTIETQRLNY